MRAARCPRCKAATVVVYEIAELTAVYDDVSLEDGRLVVRGSGLQETPPDSLRYRLGCDTCGHDWARRRAIEFVYTPEADR